MAQACEVAAFFDVDRTLVGPRSMERVFLRCLLRRRFVTPLDLARYLGHLCRHPGQLGRGLAQTSKEHLRHKQAGELDRLARACFQERIAPMISPAGREAVEGHRRQGHLVVLLTGSLEPLAAPLAAELKADVILAASLAEERGRLTGALSNARPYGQEKARLARELARARGLDLGRCYAYGDHHSDRFLLAAVGNPFAVNPHPLLRREAILRGWPILEF